MKNNYFEIKFNPDNGSVSSITNLKDPHKMNWCIEDGGWGLIQYNNTFEIEPIYKKRAPFQIYHSKNLIKPKTIVLPFMKICL